MEVRPQPYVNNQGLRATLERKLINLQLNGPDWLSAEQKDWKLPSKEWQSRLSMIAWVQSGTSKQVPIQALLEKGEVRKSWNVTYLSHGWHRYVGRFPPHVVRAVLNVFRVSPPQLVLDPFAGSGTALVEARLLGIDAFGIEICPLSQLIASVKCALDFPSDRLQSAWSAVERTLECAQPTKLHHYSYQKRLAEEYTIPDFPNKERWFNTDVLVQLSSLLSAICSLDDTVARKFIFVAVSSSMRSIANVDVDVVRTEYRRKPRTNVDVLGIIRRKVRRMIQDLEVYASLKLRQAEVTCKLGDARKIDLPPSSVDFVISSPPYGIEAISYLRTHMLSYRVLAPVLGVDYKELGRRMIGTDFVMDWDLKSTNLMSATARSFFDNISRNSREERNRTDQMIQYYQDLEQALAEISRVLKPGGNAAIVIGNKKLLGKPLPTHRILEETAKELGLRTRSTLPVKLVCNNPTSHTPWSERMIRDEHIVFLSK